MLKVQTAVQPHTFRSTCVCAYVTVCVSEQWNEILSRLAADQQKAKQRRKNGWKRPTRAAAASAASAAARKAEFVAAAKRPPCRMCRIVSRSYPRGAA